MKKNIVGLVIGLTLALVLGACGYSTPEGGGGITPYVVIVTPTVNPAGAQEAKATPVLPPTETPVPTAVPTATPNLELSTDNKYTVQKGDTILGIAIRLKVDANELVILNKLANPDALQIGQVLKVPPRKPTPTAGS